MRTLKLSLAAALAAVAVAAAAIVLTAGGSPTTPAPGGHASGPDASYQRPAFVRSLAVTTTGEPAPSAHPQRMRALLLAGRLPAGVVTATVLTDEDCAPDAQGVSHCRNKLRLPSGKTIEVRHPHRMHDVPCMTPGESVRVGQARA
jgi:hypothetical protein